MNIYFLVHDNKGDIKYIGCYYDVIQVHIAIDKLSQVEGFKDNIDDFRIANLQLNKCYDMNELKYKFCPKENMVVNRQGEFPYENLIILSHCYDLDKDENTILLGVYSSEEESNNAINYYKDNYCYFNITKACFYQQKFDLNECRWNDGFCTQCYELSERYLLPGWFHDYDINVDEAYSQCKKKYKANRIDTSPGSEYYFIKKFIEEKRN